MQSAEGSQIVHLRLVALDGSGGIFNAYCEIGWSAFGGEDHGIDLCVHGPDFRAAVSLDWHDRVFRGSGEDSICRRVWRLLRAADAGHVWCAGIYSGSDWSVAGLLAGEIGRRIRVGIGTAAADAGCALSAGAAATRRSLR